VILVISNKIKKLKKQILAVEELTIDILNIQNKKNKQGDNGKLKIWQYENNETILQL